MNTTTTETALLRPRSVLLNGNFMLLFAGKVISQLGDQIYSFALSWYILDLTKSSLLMSTFLVVNGLIYALAVPFGGIIADRVSRKGIMVWMDAVRGVVVLMAAFLLSQQMLQLWMLYLGGFILAFCGAFFTPAASAIIPNIVTKNQLARASSMDQFVWSFCTFTGMVVSGILYDWVGITVIFLLNAISYFLSGVMEAAIGVPKKKQTPSGVKESLTREFQKVIQELAAGFQNLKTKPVVFNLTLLFAMFNLIAYPLGMIIIPYIFNVILQATPLQLALALGSTWGGMIIGSFIVPFFIERIQLKKVIFWGLFTCSICWLIIPPLLLPQVMRYLHFGNWEFTVFFMIVSIILGLALISFNISSTVFFQKNISDEFRGRFWGLMSAAVSITVPVGYLAGGFLAQNVWVGFLFWGSALAAFGVNLWGQGKLEA